MSATNTHPPRPLLRPMEPLAVRPATAAHLLSISERSLWTHIAQGRLTVSRLGNVTLVHMASIHALLAAPGRPPDRRADRLRRKATAKGSNVVQP